MAVTKQLAALSPLAQNAHALQSKGTTSAPKNQLQNNPSTSHPNLRSPEELKRFELCHLLLENRPLLKGTAQGTAGLRILKPFIMQMAHLLLLS